MKHNEKDLVNIPNVFVLLTNNIDVVIIAAFQEYSAQCGQQFLSSLRKRTTAHHGSS